MRSDAVGTGMDRELGRAHRIGVPPAPGVADGRDVIDVDAKAKLRNVRHVLILFLGFDNSRRHPVTRSAADTTFFARNCAMMALRCLRS